MYVRIWARRIPREGIRRGRRASRRVNPMGLSACRRHSRQRVRAILFPSAEPGSPDRSGMQRSGQTAAQRMGRRRMTAAAMARIAAANAVRGRMPPVHRMPGKTRAIMVTLMRHGESPAFLLFIMQSTATARGVAGAITAMPAERIMHDRSSTALSVHVRSVSVPCARLVSGRRIMTKKRD